MRTRPMIATAISIAVVASFALAARPRISVRPTPSVPTYSREISRLFQQHCESCHREGDIAPFALTSYAEAKPAAAAIKRMVTTHQMPPWKPESSCEPLQGERVLSDAEIATIARWVDAGAPEGNPADLPKPTEHGSDWSAGEPDLVLTMPATYEVGEGHDVYRCFPIDPKKTTDLSVRGFDTRPGNRELVHHVIAYLDTTDASAALDARDPEPGYPCFGGPGFSATNALGGWAPGARPTFLPDGVALKLPANAKVVLQVHYHPHHGAGSDRTSIGLYFAKAAVTSWLRYLPLLNDTFVIPPGAKEHPVDALAQIPWFVSAKIWNVTPHMHLLGRTMRVDLITPTDSSPRCLINIDDWDFNWQGTYAFKEPIAVPGGSMLRMHATFDNSADNDRNPNTPPKAVMWGEETTDEMAVVFFGVTVDGFGFSEDAPVWQHIEPRPTR